MATMPSAQPRVGWPKRLPVICLAIAVVALGVAAFARYVHD